MKKRMVYQTDKTREKIIHIAENLFIKNGFADTQMKDIAAATEMSRNTLYRYYQDKYDLGFSILVMVLKRKIDVYSQIMSDIETGQYPNIRDGINALLNAYANIQDQEDDLFIAEFDGYYAGSRIPEAFRDSLSEVLPDKGNRLANIIALGQAEGSIRSDLAAKQLSITLSNAVPTFFRRMLQRKNALLEAEQESIPLLTPVLIQLLIDGIRP